MANHISMIGSLTMKYVIVTPRKLLFDGDGPPFFQEFADTLEDAKVKLSRLIDAKIYLNEVVTVEGFTGILSRSREISK